MQSQINPQTQLKISDFISIASQLSFSACEIIKQGSENKKLGKYQKGHDDPVTEADYHVQTMIINGLRKFFPKLRIIGEETVDYQGKIEIDYECLELGSYPQNAKFNDLTVPYEQLCVWIDPIDCTKGFINGQMDYVTNLIGMSRNKQAFLGVIGVPYKIIEGNLQFRPSVTIGVSETKEAFVYSKQNKWTPLNRQKVHTPSIITNTKGRVCQKFTKLVEQLKFQSLYAEGSGRKIMMVINGEADLLVYLSSYTSKWDTCAGEAIVKALGGYFCTPQKEQIQYDPDAESYKNPSGQICSMNKELIDQVLEFLDRNKHENQ